MGAKKRKPTPGSEPPAVEVPELPERWSASRKTELVMRLLRGEALDAISRESQVPAHELESWERVFLEQGTRGLRIRGEPKERELTLARAKIGELMMRLELAEDLIEKARMKAGHAPSWRRAFTKEVAVMYSIGVDFHKAYSHMTVLDPQGRVLRAGRVPNTKKGIRHPSHPERTRSLPMRGFESG